jgi:cholesterol oxidase
VKYDYDYIIVGSGFGGSVSALRLSQKGYRVLVVEKGKWYGQNDFPKTNWNIKRWLWMPALGFYGIMKITIFRHMAILSGTGVGGGSLVYANTLPVPKSKFFTSGSWSGLADWEQELKPFYEKALRMLGASKNPKLFDGDIALKNLAEQMNLRDGFEKTDVAVFFGTPDETVEDPYFGGDGPERTGCNFCGACMTGCRYNAKNTLDKNYLYLAQKEGARILAENEVVDVRPIDNRKGADGYKVTVRAKTALGKRKKTFTAKGVVFSGGVLGTVRLLLKLKTKSLPNLSGMLGRDIRSNNETLVSVATLDKNKDVSQGVAIGSILHTDENSHLEIVRYGKGSGFWKTLHLPYTTGRYIITRFLKVLLRLVLSPVSYFRIYFLNNWAQSTAVLLFMQTVDSKLRFRINGFGRMTSAVTQGKKPTPDIPESRELTGKYGEIIHGKPMSFVLESIAGIPSTAHILGGAVMGADRSKGVTDKYNKVFGYDNMYVVDGSVISANPGVNPALSITAIAERAMHHIPPKNENDGLPQNNRATQND